MLLALGQPGKFAPRSVFLGSFPWSSSIGQLLRVLTRQGVGPRWAESAAAQGQRPSRSGVSCPGLSLHVLLPPRAARDSCPLVLLSPGPPLPSFWTHRGDPPYRGPGLAHLLFSLPFTWNQVEWPPCISQATTGVHNMETWRSVLCCPGRSPRPPRP